MFEDAIISVTNAYENFKMNKNRLVEKFVYFERNIHLIIINECIPS